MMTLDQQLSVAASSDGIERSGLASLLTGLTQWVGTCIAYYDAAATYEDLARLSNAELQRRGLSRDTLARDVCSLCERHD
jgi:hypothetical protein